MSDSTTAAHPTAKAGDFRKITRVASLLILGHDLSSRFPDGCTVAIALREIITQRGRGADTVRVEFDGLATLKGQPDEVIPFLVGLLTHADSGASSE